MAEPLIHAHDVLVAARSGSQDAGRRLMAEHGPSMLRTAWSVLGRYGGQEAEDVVQEAFIAALTTGSLPQGDTGAWLRAITVRKALDAVRAAHRRSERSLSAPGSDAATGADLPSNEAALASAPAAGSEAILDVIAVREALAGLSPEDRAVLVLVDMEGFSMAEAAAALGSTNVALRLRAMRARRKLARRLGAPSGRRTGMDEVRS